MQIPNDCAQYFHFLSKGNRKTLKDAQTKLFIRADHDLYWVDVDRGIIQNVGEGIRKCDFLCYLESEEGTRIIRDTHLIELKGAIIKNAFEQISNTIRNLKSNHDVSFLVDGIHILDAYIVSSGRQEVPNGVDEMKRKLARELARCCSQSVDNIFSLVKLVKVVSNAKTQEVDKNIILCSNEAPITF